MKVVFNRGDLFNLDRLQAGLIKEIIAVDPSAVTDFDDTKDSITQIRDLAVAYPKLLTITEVDDEVTIEYAEGYLGDSVEVMLKIAPIILPVVHAIDKVISLFSGAIDKIKEEVFSFAENYI